MNHDLPDELTQCFRCGVELNEEEEEKYESMCETCWINGELNEREG